MRLARLVFAASLVFFTTQAFAAAPSVTIDSGTLAGSADGSIEIYKGIPYAAAPVGAMRWMPPAPVRAWSGTRDASAFGPICPQPARGDGTVAAGFGNAQSEDCLSLNIWAPQGAKNAPVMGWIHGGAHRFGSSASPIYDGSAFARDGIVFVSINYRLGILGYFAHPALTKAAAVDAPLGNYGAMDQLAALKWVQRNIARFGGDPRNVTVFGESAGGASILHLLATPSAKGLFAKAIVQSGGGWTQIASLASKEADGIAFAARAGLADATIEQLRALPADKTFDVPLAIGFGPFADGRLIPETPAQAFASGRAIDVPLIIGSNSFEASLMTAFSIPPATIVGRMGPVERAVYAGDGDTDEKLAQAVFTDSAFGAPARWVAARAADGAPSYLYHFGYVATMMRALQPGARHGSEIPYAFATLDAVAQRFGMTPSAEDAATVKLMHGCWVNFARSGDPGCGGWQAYSSASDRLMEFAPSSGPKERFRKAQYDALEARLLALYGVAR